MLRLRNLKKHLTQRNLVILLAVSAVMYYMYTNNMLQSLSGLNQKGGDTSNEKATIVLFYAPWCPHCKDIMPMWDSIAKKHKDDTNVNVKKVNCEDQPEQAEKNEVAAFPTIILFKNGQPIKYTGDRDEESIENFISNTNSRNNTQ